MKYATSNRKTAFLRQQMFYPVKASKGPVRLKRTLRLRVRSDCSERGAEELGEGL